jgi:hypothetical protein
MEFLQDLSQAEPPPILPQRSQDKARATAAAEARRARAEAGASRSSRTNKKRSASSGENPSKKRWGKMRTVFDNPVDDLVKGIVNLPVRLIRDYQYPLLEEVGKDGESILWKSNMTSWKIAHLVR